MFMSIILYKIFDNTINILNCNFKVIIPFKNNLNYLKNIKFKPN